MGTQLVSGRRLRDRDRLVATVQQLVDAGVIEAPDALPRYVRTPNRPGIGQGWVWQPAGQPWQTLGSNAYLAHARLMQLYDAEVA